MIDLKNAPFYLTQEQIAWVESTLASLTTEEKAGQLFCVMGGDYAPETLKEMVGAGKVGGILFRPVVTGAQIRAAYAPLDQVAKVPLLKAANLEEGGCGGMSDGTLFGWPMLTAATDDPAVAEKFGRVCGTEGAQVGINWTFSPVCDLDLNYLNPITNVRTFGSDRERVKAMTERYVKAVQACGVAACAKHFPGDGVDYRDQHLHPSVNSLHADRWYDSYGKIYENLIAGGLMSVMVGHIAQPYVAMDVNPELTFEEAMLPATLSRTLLTGVLREKYGFNGVITSDATIMGGYTMAMERRKAIPASIMAGCDMLVFNTDFEEDYRYILDALENGSLTMARLEEAVTRIIDHITDPTIDTDILPDLRLGQKASGIFESKGHIIGFPDHNVFTNLNHAVDQPHASVTGTMGKVDRVVLALQLGLDRFQIGFVFLNGGGVGFMEEGQIITGIPQQKRPFLPDQHDDTASGMAGQVIDVDMHPAQIEAVAPGHLPDPGQILCRNDLRFLHLLGTQEQAVPAEVHIRVLDVDIIVRMVHVHGFKLSGTHGMIHMSMGQKHKNRFVRQFFHIGSQKTQTAPGIDQGGFFPALYQIHQLHTGRLDAGGGWRDFFMLERNHNFPPLQSCIWQTAESVHRTGAPERGFSHEFVNGQPDGGSGCGIGVDIGADSRHILQSVGVCQRDENTHFLVDEPGHIQRVLGTPLDPDHRLVAGLLVVCHVQRQPV